MALTNGVHANGDAAPLADDTVTSPYTTRAITIKIGTNGDVFTAFEAMLDRYPGLQARMNSRKPGAPVELPEVDADVGHTLVHFLFTGDYNTLGLGGVPEHVRATAEFKRSILAYCAARLCTINALEELTKTKMERYSKQISISELHKVVLEVDDKIPMDDVWFPEHLFRWVKNIFHESDDLVVDRVLLDLIGRCSLFDKAVVRSLSEMYQEKSSALAMLLAGAPQSRAENHNALVEGQEGDLPLHCSRNDSVVSHTSRPNDDPPVLEPIEKTGATGQFKAELVEVGEEHLVASDSALCTKTDVIAPQSTDGTIRASSPEQSTDANILDNAERPALEDSEVEAAREKSAKKKKNKNKKKANGA